MSDTFPLPLECLRFILGTLATDRELATLASLLRVNKYTCLATLPFIYENPLTWFDSKLVSGRRVRPKNVLNRTYVLMQLLLGFVHEGSCSGLIKATYGSTSELAPPQAWGINYLSYTRKFHSLAEELYTLLCPESAFDPSPSLRQYIIENELPYKYWSQKIDDRQPIDPDPDDELKDFDSLDFLNEDINRELTWSLCNTIFEQLQGITIPLSDIDRYLDLMPRLSSLQSVTFFLDGVAGWFEGEFEELSNVQQELVRQRKVRRVQELEAAVKFVKAHAATFRGTLRKASIPQNYSPFEENNHTDWFVHKPWSCPDTYRSQMMDCLPGLINPTSLTNKNWLQFAAKAEQTDVSHVATIDMDELTGSWYQLLKSKPLFLHHCRDLRVYRMVSLGPNSFKSIDRKDHQDTNKNGIWFPTKLHLPFLKHVSILAYNEPFGSELDDIGHSCGETIQYLNIRGHQGLQGDTTILPVRIGDWKMPVLSMLFVQTGSERLIVDPDFLRHCPSLEIVALSDNHRTYRLNEIEHGQPALLPKLIRLLLCGSAALSFHPDTLHSTKELEIMALGTPEGPQDQNALSTYAWDTAVPKPLHSDYEDTAGTMLSFPRPQWTWDWFLPKLVNLELSVGFALHFQFRMLQGCPSLRELSLSIFSEEGRVERVLTENDFIVDATTYGHVDGDKKYFTPEASQDVGLHSLTLHDFYEIQNRFTREGPQGESQLGIPLSYEPPPPTSRSTERTFEQYRSRSLMSSRRYRHGRVFNPDGIYNKAAVNPREGCDEQIRIIENQVVQEPLLQPILDRFMEEKRAAQEKKVREDESQRRFQMAHPECLVVPSLRKLLIFGHWVISDEVLAIMLGRVFRNLEQVNQYQCEGFEDETWVRITKEMPYLRNGRILWS